MSQKIGNSKNKIASFLIGCALVATSCGEPKERQMAYMTPAERDDYESYGFLPDDIEESNSSDTYFVLAGVLLLAIAIGATKIEDAVKKRRNQRLQQMQKNNQK